MKVIFRVDSSLKMGTGHVMRCLTLAQTLQEKGALVDFICREHLGNLIEFIETKGFNVHRLPLHVQGGISEQRDALLTNMASTQQPCLKSTRPDRLAKNTLFHSYWLGSTQYEDAQECMAVLKTLNPDWLIIDHYALDETWQVLLEDHYHKLMVIDDLADRKHQCNLLLDQTFGRKPEDYQALVPEKCHMLLGSQYALLRPEFSQWREYSLKRREYPEFKKLLITMGGVDPKNVTGQVLSALTKCNVPKNVEVVVILGATAPHLEEVSEQVKILPYKAQVKVNVSNMAEIMANSDLAIGAAGATTWERCCLGLPAIQLTIVENQKFVSQNLNKSGAVISISYVEEVSKGIKIFEKSSIQLSVNSASICDGSGADKVSRRVLKV